MPIKNMKTIWKLFTDCKSEKAARRLSIRHFTRLGQEPDATRIEPYHKGGFVVCAVGRLSAQTWQEAIFQALLQAQMTGREWILSGDIHELDAWSNDSVVSGIISIHLRVRCAPDNSSEH
jgi:hypothetical protein